MDNHSTWQGEAGWGSESSISFGPYPKAHPHPGLPRSRIRVLIGLPFPYPEAGLRHHAVNGLANMCRVAYHVDPEFLHAHHLGLGGVGLSADDRPVVAHAPPRWGRDTGDETDQRLVQGAIGPGLAHLCCAGRRRFVWKGNTAGGVFSSRQGINRRLQCLSSTGV